MKPKKYTLAEFFSGCGGTSRGFARSGRFDILLGNDVKSKALKTFEYNHKGTEREPEVINEDLRKLDIAKILNSLKRQGVGKGELDCLLGGPPCQGFSQLRRSEYREDGKGVKFRGYSKLSHDPRNDLVLRFLEVAEAIQPKTIVIENVPQMLNHGFEGRLGRLSESVVDILEKDLGYHVDVCVLNAADYGVPQLRERAFFIASSQKKVGFPAPSHTHPENLAVTQKGLFPWVSVEEAISDLVEPSFKSDKLGGASIDLYKKTRSSYAKMMQSSAYFPYNHITRNYKKSVMDIIGEMRPGKTWDAESQRMRERYQVLINHYAKQEHTSEETAKRSLEAKGVINPVFYKKYYWSAYSRLAWDQPALTITANSNFLGSGRFTHPDDMRGITMREAARLQSFDDDFTFITSDDATLDTTRIGVGMDMIGEAVPPLLAKALAEHIALNLEDRGAGDIFSADKLVGNA